MVPEDDLGTKVEDLADETVAIHHVPLDLLGVGICPPLRFLQGPQICLRLTHVVEHAGVEERLLIHVDEIANTPCKQAHADAVLVGSAIFDRERVEESAYVSTERGSYLQSIKGVLQTSFYRNYRGLKILQKLAHTGTPFPFYFFVLCKDLTSKNSTEYRYQRQ